MSSHHVDPSELRAAFALGLSEMYAAEVPLYDTLLDTCAAVNAEHRGGGLDTAARVGDERHGAIRLGSNQELAAMAQLFALLAMRPVGLYDLRDTTASSLPIVATAFRPTTSEELEASAFRMFTSVLVPGDRRFFDAETGAEIERRVRERTLFPIGLSDLVAQCTAQGGVAPSQADALVGLAVDALRLDDAALDLEWHRRLAEVSPVAADIAGAPSTHLNHLTPRVFDIVAAHRRLEDQGIAMIDRIQGPAEWAGPSVLLRQTSFRALDEDRRAVDAEGRAVVESVRVRFGEVEQRGVSVTRVGREIVDRCARDQTALDDVFPADLEELGRTGVANVRFVRERGRRVDVDDVWTSVEVGAVTVEPITYEDFLPASATGIFESNLTHVGRRSDAGGTLDRHGDTALADLVSAVGRVLDPHELADAEQGRSLARLAEAPTS